jgi:hypothetical protein
MMSRVMYTVAVCRSFDLRGSVSDHHLSYPRSKLFLSGQKDSFFYTHFSRIYHPLYLSFTPTNTWWTHRPHSLSFYLPRPPKQARLHLVRARAPEVACYPRRPATTSPTRGLQCPTPPRRIQPARGVSPAAVPAYTHRDSSSSLEVACRLPYQPPPAASAAPSWRWSTGRRAGLP